MAPQLYGWQHILYLAITITLMTALWITIKKCARSERAVRIAVKLTALVLLAMILWNRWSICYYRDGFAFFLPQSFCGFSSLALALSVLLLPKDSAVLHCVTYVSILGGTVTMFYPDFIGQNESFLYPMTISGMLHHTVAVFLGVSLIMTGYLVPRLKKWVYLPLGLCVYIAYGMLLITALGYSDAMQLYTPLIEGTVLTWYFTGFLFCLLHFGFLFVWERLKRRSREPEKAGSATM